MISAMSGDERKLLVYGLGAIGALAIGYQGYQHMFVEGLTDVERKMMFRVGIMGASVWAVRTFVDMRQFGEYAQWIDPTGMFTAGQP